jgi:hypothetical protein
MSDKYRGVENPDAARAAAERAQSGAWGTHDNRPKRERSRDAAKRAAIKREDS